METDSYEREVPMVADAVTEHPKTWANSPGWSRLLVTVLLLSLYALGRFVPLPGLWIGGFVAPVHLLVLGTAPLWIGFALAAALSRSRRPGRYGLAAGLLVAVVEGIFLARWLGISETWLPPVIVLTLTGVTAGLFALGQLLSKWGIGNGFALLTLVGVVQSLAAADWSALNGEAVNNSPAPLVALLLMAGLFVLVFRSVTGNEALGRPAFPQSVFPVQWSLWLLAPPALPWLGFPFGFWRWTDLPWYLALVLVPLLSAITFRLFSRGEPGGRRALRTTALLAFGAAATLAWSQIWPRSPMISFLEIVMAAAIAGDLLEELRFRRNGPLALLARLDDVHLSYDVTKRLGEADVEVLARGRRFRSLFFILGALCGIDLLVPAEQLERAREVLAKEAPGW